MLNKSLLCFFCLSEITLRTGSTYPNCFERACPSFGLYQDPDLILDKKYLVPDLLHYIPECTPFMGLEYSFQGDSIAEMVKKKCKLKFSTTGSSD
jgi:hypothetical protein